MIVAPSLLAADFTRLADDIDMIERSQAQWIHCDVMDGVFVPNISFGFPVIKAVRSISDMPIDVHLMIVDPGRYVSAVRDTGATMMNVHLEACTHLHRVVESIHQAGMRAGVTLCPATPVSSLRDIIQDLDMVLLMSVNPGFGGQSFINHTLVKIAELKQLIDDAGSDTLIEVDGGINAQTAPRVVEAGADILVAGSYVFSAQNPKEVISSLKSLQK